MEHGFKIPFGRAFKDPTGLSMSWSVSPLMPMDNSEAEPDALYRDVGFTMQASACSTDKKWSLWSISALEFSVEGIVHRAERQGPDLYKREFVGGGETHWLKFKNMARKEQTMGEVARFITLKLTVTKIEFELAPR